MSVAAVARVWERSKAKGSELLVLLAIADYAHDDGRDAWPTVEKLAAKSRMSERAVYDVLDRLKAMNELGIEKNQAGRTVRGGYRPRQFMHVLCCGGEPAESAGSSPKRNLKKLQAEPAESAGSDPAETAGGTCSPPHDEPADSSNSNKEDPLVIRQQPLPGRVCVGRNAHPLDEPAVIGPAAVALFDELWNVYPDKTNRVGALRAWHALQPTEELARFVIAHVKVRVAAGWGRELSGVFQPRPPFLARFLDERRWQEQYRPPRLVKPTTTSAAVEGQLVMRSCRTCGVVVEGHVVNGVEVYAACPRCASAGLTSDQEHARSVM